MKVLLAVDVLGTKLDCVVFDAPTPISPHTENTMNRELFERIFHDVGMNVPGATVDHQFESTHALHSVVPSNGQPADEIVKAAAKEHVDMILMGSRGRGSMCSIVLGTVAKKVAAQTTVPVTIMS
jgi:Universal stress protein family